MREQQTLHQIDLHCQDMSYMDTWTRWTAVLVAAITSIFGDIARSSLAYAQAHSNIRQCRN